jgi:hypothetical protein
MNDSRNISGQFFWKPFLVLFAWLVLGLALAEGQV